MKLSSDRENYAIKCKLIRKGLKLTQQEIADSLGLKVSTISKFESGKINNLDLFIYYTEVLSKHLD